MKRISPLPKPPPSAGAPPLPAGWPIGWRLDRRVPPMLLFALALQVFTLVAWGAYLEARVTVLERAAAASSDLSEKFARLEERIDGLRGDIAQVRHQLDRMHDGR